MIVALIFVASPVLSPAGPGGLRGAGPDLARGRRHARRFRGAGVRAGRHPGRGAGTRHRRRPLAWGRALGGVRRDAGVRRLVPGDHADGAAGDRRALRSDLPGALALSAVLVGFSAALLAAVKLVSAGGGVRPCCRLTGSSCGSGGSTCELSLDVRPNRVLALVGPSGAGKTSLLGASPGSSAPPRGASPAAARPGTTRRRGSPLAGGPALRLRVPGLRAVRPPSGVAERRLPVARRRASGAAPAGGRAARRVRPRRPRRRAPGGALGR